VPAKASASATVSAIPRRRAIRIATLSHHARVATEIVDVTLAVLAEPDAEMLEAGMVELAQMFPPTPLPGALTKAQLRALAGVVWGAMLYRARV
jgi:hypothetical protein